MERLHSIAMAYYKAAPSNLQREISELFGRMDADGDNKISLQEFLAFTRREPSFAPMNNRYFFNELNRDQTGRLDFKDIVTFFYILKSGRPFCNGCKMFMPSLYFTCVPCFNREGAAFCLCLECFKNSRNFGHQHDEYLDNFALLEGVRKNAVARRHTSRPSTSTTIVVANQHSRPSTSTKIVVANQHSRPSTSTTIVVANQHGIPSTPTAIVRRDRNLDRNLRTFFGVMNKVFGALTIVRRVVFGF